jgi:hypothetical protein
MMGGLSGWLLVGNVVHLMMIAVVPVGVWLRWPGPGSAGLRRVLGLPLRLNNCVDGDLRTWRTSQIIGIALVDSWVGP